MNSTPPSILGTPITLPVSKQRISNRFIKAATTENLANPRTGQPNDRHCCLYSRFVGCGMVLTGNVMVDRKCKESTRNVVLDETSDLEPFRKWSRSFQDGKAIMQISHPGRQSPLSVTGWSKNPVAPTSGIQARLMLPGWLGNVLGSLFLRPARELLEEEIPHIVEQFATTARLAEEAGFDGVEIHAAHGYLLSQFLSPAANLRTDTYGGDVKKRRKLLLEVIRKVRAVTSQDFIVGVKINSKDRQVEGKDREDECIELIHELCLLQQLDFIELSGGGFEDALMVKNVMTPGDGFFFNSFAERLQHSLQTQSNTSPAVVLTGGFRTVKGMERAVNDGLTDIIGLGRPLCMDPTFCREVLENRKTEVENFPLSFVIAKSVVEPALNSLWYSRQLSRLSLGLEPDANLSILYTLLGFIRFYIWDWGGRNKEYL